MGPQVKKDSQEDNTSDPLHGSVLSMKMITRQLGADG